MRTFIRNIISLRNSSLYYPFTVLFFINVGLSSFFGIGLFGKLKIIAITSNSMLPTISQGSLSLIEKQAPNSYSKGDVVAFYVENNKEEIITHRIYKIGGNVYITKGDNNKAMDPQLLKPRLIIGKVVKNISYLGYYVSLFNKPFGNLLLIIFPAIIFIGCEMTNIYLLSKQK